MPKSKKVLLGVTGSIAAYKACDVLRRLQDKGYEVAVLMTREAERFVTPLTFESLAGQRVYRDMFSDGENSWEMSHIKLCKEAACLLIAPATANTIGKLANGIADDMLSCTAMVMGSRVLIAPAMNDEMFANKIVQQNCEKLTKVGVRFIEPIKGRLACGTLGLGHLADVEDIVKAVVAVAK